MMLHCLLGLHDLSSMHHEAAHRESVSLQRFPLDTHLKIVDLFGFEYL